MTAVNHANPVRVTRLAPSPTGALHLGNARTFLINWVMARQQGWTIALRIDDLDGPRIKPGAGQAAIQDLTWLGIDWDTGPLLQSDDLTPYRSVLFKLLQAGMAYGCDCTRKDLMTALSAPHAEDHDLRYPGTCRARALVPADADHARHDHHLQSLAVRFIVEPGVMNFTDQVVGEENIDVDEQSGDFVIWTKTGLPSYQLAVVIDDIRQGVTDVVRGSDLIPSTARQILLYHALQALGLRDPLTPLPHWWHLPLVLGPDGRRLAKRHGDTRVAWYREHGVSAEKIIGMLGHLSGISDTPIAMTAADFRNRFDLRLLPAKPVTFTPEMHQWLLS